MSRFCLLILFTLVSNSILGAIIDITDYGADPSGQTSSYKSIKAAHDAAQSGDTVYFPAGTYFLGNQYRPDRYLFTMKSGVTWQGPSLETTTIRMALPPYGKENRLFNSTPGTMVEKAVFRSLRFENGGFCLRFEDTKDCVVDNCVLYNSQLIVFARLEEGRYGNTGTRITNCRFDSPDYRFSDDNPTYDPTRIYSIDSLYNFNHYNAFLVRVISSPWDYDAPGDAKNENILIKNCFFRHGTYNAIEVAGHRSTKVSVVENEFRENFGVAIDFDKGASFCEAVGNEIYDMLPAQAYADLDSQLYVEYQALSSQNGGLNQALVSTDNLFEGNKLKQTKEPYRKFRSRDGYRNVIRNNEILAGDAGGDALVWTYTSQRSGTVGDATTIEGNNFRTGEVIFGGNSGGPPIREAIIVTDNQFNDRVRFFAKDFTQAEFSGNTFNAQAATSPAIAVNGSATVEDLSFTDCTFLGGGNEIDLNAQIASLTMTGNQFTNFAQVNSFPTAQAVWKDNGFQSFNNNVVLSGSSPVFILDGNSFCQTESGQVFSLVNCADLQLSNNRIGVGNTNRYQTTGSTITLESGNFWQGAALTNCRLPVSSSAGTGLTYAFCSNKTLSGTPTSTGIDATVDFDWQNASPAPSLPNNNFSVRWQGQVQPQYSEEYTFFTQADDGTRLWVNGQLLVDDWTNHAVREKSGKITLEAGQKYDVKLEYFENGGRAVCKLLWRSTSQNKQIIPKEKLFPSNEVATRQGSSVQKPKTEKALSMRVYPNPSTTGSFTVQSVSSLESNISLFDLYGKRISIIIQPIDTQRIRLQPQSPLPEGVYLLRFQDPDGTVTQQKIMRTY